MIETKDFWIYNNIIIFKPEFNDSIEPYYNLISKYDSLIFSNISEPEMSFIKNSIGCLLYNDEELYNLSKKNMTEILKKSVFNKQLSLPNNIKFLVFGFYFNQLINLPDNLTSLFFGEYFNQLVNLPKNLINLSFGYYFNQQVEFPDSLINLSFGDSFNQPVNLPKNLLFLSLGGSFNQQIEIPNIKRLKINCNNLFVIDNLPNSLEQIYFDSKFKLEINNLPNSLKKINFLEYSTFKKPIDNLPDSVEILNLPFNYAEKINKLPKNLTMIYYNKTIYIDNFEPLLERIKNKK